MPLTSLQVQNFKSFDSADIQLGQFGVLIGANSAGKSNFLSIFRFLRDIARVGLPNAVSLQGGVEYLRNIKIGTSQPLALEVEAHGAFGGTLRSTHDGLLGVRSLRTRYRFEIEFPARSRLRVASEELEQEWLVERVRFARQRLQSQEELGRAAFRVTRKNGTYRPELELPDDLAVFREELLPSSLWPEKASATSLLLEDIPWYGPPWTELFRDTGLYDIDPKLPKKAVPVTGTAELEEDGSNLAIIISNVIRSPASRRQLQHLIQDVLPFVERLGVDEFADTSLLFKLQERYTPRRYFPASLLSDGTLHVTALVLALFFESKPFQLIEEPERNLHPFLIARLVSLLREASESRQILVTTHNPEVIRHAGAENLLLLQRDKHGFTKVTRATSSARVKRFLEQELGLADLYVQGFLGS